MFKNHQNEKRSFVITLSLTSANIKDNYYSIIMNEKKNKTSEATKKTTYALTNKKLPQTQCIIMKKLSKNQIDETFN